MPANTPKGYPYPLGTDRLMDGDDAIHNLATQVDTALGVAASGTVTTPTTVSLDTAVSVAVTFPAGRFTAAPVVALGVLSPQPQRIGVGTGSITAAGCTIFGGRTSGGMGTIPVAWIAIQN